MYKEKAAVIKYDTQYDQLLSIYTPPLHLALEIRGNFKKEIQLSAFLDGQVSLSNGGHPSHQLKDPSAWLINKSHATEKQAAHQRSAETLIRIIASCINFALSVPTP